MRNCSCVTGKYQQTSAHGNWRSSATLGLRVGHEGQLRRLAQKAAEHHRPVRRPAIPRTVANWTNRE